MDFMRVMQVYFRGERIEALCYILPAGVILLGLAATAWASHKNGFGVGLAVPLVVLGLTTVAVGIAVGLKTPNQVDQLESAYRDDPAAMVSKELPRMQAVNENWPRLVMTWASLILIGMTLRFLLRHDWAHGAGIALILCGAVGLLIDGFAERRARPYTDELERLSVEHQ
jgi:hypothetical protein